MKIPPLTVPPGGNLRHHVNFVFTSTRVKNSLNRRGESRSWECFLAEDLKFELSILATVQGFYQKLMRDSLGGDVPIPNGLDEVLLRHSENLPETLSRMYRWLHLLDMAITPAMLRQALTPDTDSELAEALLRYFVRRREP